MSKELNFTLYYEEEISGYAAYTFHIVDGDMDWAMRAGGEKLTDREDMRECLRAAHASGLPARTVED